MSSLRKALLAWQQSPEVHSLMCQADITPNHRAELLVMDEGSCGVLLHCPECTFEKRVREDSELAQLVLMTMAA
jgi:hypothetical protein